MGAGDKLHGDERTFGLAPCAKTPCVPGSASLLVLIPLWYGCSAASSITTKEILRAFPYPITVAAVQQMFSAVLGYMHATKYGSGPMPGHTTERVRALTPPVIAMVGALVSYRFSLLTVSVSLTHTIKTLGPLFTMFFSFLLLGERTTLVRAGSVLPVVCGVAITTVTEVEFAAIGLVASLVSTAAQAMQMVLVKRVLAIKELDISKSELFYKIALYSLLLLLPLFLVHDAWPLYRSGWRGAGAAAHWLLINGLVSFGNQFCTVSVLDAMESPLSHALANVMKRAAIITLAMASTGRAVSALQLCGVALSVFGTLAYQQAANCMPSRVQLVRDASEEGLLLQSDASGCRGACAKPSGSFSSSSSSNETLDDPALELGGCRSPACRSPETSDDLHSLQSSGALTGFVLHRIVT
mmetsp:Transcript_29094/g.61128  ORF Transcript_29094/g.61128 Transcript_29094/m.61128 type:complete len:412 (-) Transcript_29094:286-1521(-)